MTLSETPNALKRFRQSSWKFQQTFKTPLKNLQPFVATIVSAQHIQAGCVTIDQVVFEPKHLTALLASHSLSSQYGHDWSLVATGDREIRSLLQATLSDWIDFAFVPTPEPFVVYADHDEYTTFFANTKSNLDQISEALSKQGFEQVKDYKRQL
jgi:hypothetical protein